MDLTADVVETGGRSDRLAAWRWRHPGPGGPVRLTALGATRVALAVIGTAFGMFSLNKQAAIGIDTYELGSVLVGWAFLVAGLVAWQRRPANRLGVLLTAAGMLHLVAHALRQLDSAVAFPAGVWLGDSWTLAFAAVVLAFPSGRLVTVFDRWVCWMFVIVLGPVEFIWLLYFDYPGSPGNVLAIWENQRTAGNIDTVQRFTIVVATVLMVGALLHRWWTASRPLRQLLLPVLVAACALVLGAVLIVLDKFSVEAPNLRWVLLGSQAGVPVAVLVVAARSHLARSKVAQLLVEMRSNPDTSELQGPLARALGDPSLVVGYWLPRSQSWVDGEGSPVPMLEAPGRAVRFLDRGGVRVVALDYDASLDDPGLLDAVTAAAAIALENGQLQAELKARLDDLAESRARVVEAGQAERKRLERNLHDGTQQRLVALSMQLASLERRLEPGSDERGRVTHARTEIATSLEELRDVARGLYPAVLTVGGLPMALKSMAAASAVPVTLTVDLYGRLPEPVEVTAYYVVSESLANVGKHARASSVAVRVARSATGVVVDVTDDGVGVAGGRRGSGLLGLADRVEALGGTLTLSRPSGGGTRVRAAIPCG